MRYLLDVNVLVALGVQQHVFHERTARWVKSRLSRHEDKLLTCSITELGFVRVVSQTPQFSFTIDQAKTLLQKTKAIDEGRFLFVADEHDVSKLPAWVKSAKDVTDGHLAELARGKDAVLATLDRKIPGAFLIP
jgi:predicted nucleic acid-binding protein